MASLSNIDSVYEVAMDARPSNYLVNHISWPLIDDNLNWYNLILTRSTTGYPQTPDDGVRIYTATSDAVILGVASVDSGGTIATTAGSVTMLFIGAASGKVVTSADVVQTNASLGRGAKVSIDGAGTPSIASIADIGSGYAVGDIIRIPSTTTGLGGRVATTELGIENAFHIYDTGAASAVTTNPGYGVSGTDLDAPKYYYSLFVTYFTDYTYVPNTTKFNSAIKWKKLGETESIAVKSKEVIESNGFISVKSTKDILLEHLPRFYTTLDNGSVNKDLSDFIGLLAFHVDAYLAQTSSVFNMSTLKTTDNVLLTSLLNQFGALYKNTSDISQARSLLANLVHSYEYSGSIEGISDYLEAYSGNSISTLSGKNILLDYNTSSFVESLGSWYPDPDYASYPGYFFNPPYHYTTGDGNSGWMELSDLSGTSCDTFANYLGATAYDQVGTLYNSTLAGCSSATSATTTVINGINITNTTATVTTTSSTANLIPGSKLLITSGTGVFATGTAVTSIVNDTTFTISKAPTTPLSGATVAVSNSIISRAMKVRSLTAGQPIKYYSGLRKAKIGPYYADTVITGGFRGTVFATATSSSTVNFYGYLANVVVGSTITAYGATATATSTVDSRVGYVVTAVAYDHGTNRTVVTFDRSATFTINYIVIFSDQKASRLIPLGPKVARVNDYITTNELDSSGNLLDLAIPAGTQVTSIASDGTLTLSKSLIGNIPTGSTFYFSANYLTRKPGSADSVPVTPNTPYAFGIHFNANGGSTKTTSVELTWFDSDGAVISTNTATSAAPTNASPVNQTYSTTAYKTLWYPTMVTANSPASAAYCQPSFSISSASATDFMFVDGAYLASPSKIHSIELSGNVVTVATVVPHNFKAGNKVAVYIEDGSVYNTSSADITAVGQDLRYSLYQFTYAVTNADLAVSYPTSGYAASVPMHDISISATNVVRLTKFEDARTTKYNVLANRVNLCPNPSFESDVTGWAGFTSATIARTTSDYRYTSACAAVSFSTSANSGVKYSATGTSMASIRVQAGQTYAFSAYLKILTGNTADYKVSISWFASSGGGALSTVESAVTSLSPSSTWNRLTLSEIGSNGANTGKNCTAPANATYAEVSIIKTTGSTGVITTLLDGVLFEKSQKVNEFFDGGFDGYSHESTRDSMWEGAPYLSPSHLYLNRLVTQGNIETRVTDVVYYG